MFVDFVVTFEFWFISQNCTTKKNTQVTRSPNRIHFTFERPSISCANTTFRHGSPPKAKSFDALFCWILDAWPEQGIRFVGATCRAASSQVNETAGGVVKNVECKVGRTGRWSGMKWVWNRQNIADFYGNYYIVLIWKLAKLISDLLGLTWGINRQWVGNVQARKAQDRHWTGLQVGNIQAKKGPR